MKNCALLYLDSMDLYGAPHEMAQSALHHAGELAACYSRLPSGCLIAVDDCKEPIGKHTIVKAFFDAAGIKPEFSGYITIWRKP